VQAARLAACAAWYAARAGERVGIMAFGQVDSLLRPRSGARGALAVCGALAEWDLHGEQQPAPAEPLSDALLRASRLLHGANRVLLLSDGFSCDADARPRWLAMRQHVGTGVRVVADALEQSLPPSGHYPLEHAGERYHVVLHGERQRRAFQQVLGAGSARLAQLAQSTGTRWQHVDTRTDPLVAVSAVLGAARGSR
jgi:uncharacterized protein (DUF58 family)